MYKAARHLDGVVSSNPRRWRGKQLHHHGGGVCLLFVLLWFDSWHHKLIVCKKWYKNNPKEGLCGVTFCPTLACTTPSDGGGDGCGCAFSNLPWVNSATILSMTFPTRPTMLTPLQWPCRDKRQWHVKRGRGWATTQRHLPSLSVAVATDQFELPKDIGSQFPSKIVGRNGPDQLYNGNGHRRMGGGTTWTTLQLRKTTCGGNGRTGTRIESNCNVKQQKLRWRQWRGWMTTTRKIPPRGENMQGGSRQGGGIDFCLTAIGPYMAHRFSWY